MKTREIQETLRKGNMNEKSIAHILCVLNEKIEAQNQSIAELVRTVNSLASFMKDHAEASSVMYTWLDRLKTRLGDVDVTSEAVNDKVHLTGFEGKS